MLSRIARGLYRLGRLVERGQHVARILEVNHKMNLDMASLDEANVWAAISESFECGLDRPTEEELYGQLVLSRDHPYSVRRCIESARDEGRAMRDHISEEMWIHLNRTHLELVDVCFDDIVRMGRSEFNRQIEVFGNALHGLANDTMIRGEAWAFLQIGKYSERATMICRVLEIKRKSLALAPESEGAPTDVHQWQALLRSLAGYEPYRRAYDARIVPERVLEFVVQRSDFPHSLACTSSALRAALAAVPGSTAAQGQLARDVDCFLDELRLLDTAALAAGSWEIELRTIDRRARAFNEALELAYFTSLRPTPNPIAPSPPPILVPQ